jgi:CIC family chloride channel protein
MGAVLAGTTHASISAVLIIFEMTRDYGVILPLMIACVVAAGVARWLSPHSLYTAVLFRRGVRLPEVPRPAWMRERPIAALVRPDPATVAPGLPFAEVTLQLLALPPGHDLYVVDPSGRYLGALILDRLKGHLPDREHLAMVVAADVMDRGVIAIPASASIEAAAGRFAATELGKLPVVDDAGHLIGTLAHVDVLLAVRG